MDIGRHCAGFVERPDTNETDKLTHATSHDEVVAPDGDLAFRAARDSLFGAARRRHLDIDNISLEQMDPICLDQRVDCECRPGLPLAKAAMAAVDYQWLRLHVVSHVPTAAATLVNIALCRHVRTVLPAARCWPVSNHSSGGLRFTVRFAFGDVRCESHHRRQVRQVGRYHEGIACLRQVAEFADVLLGNA